MHVEPSMKTKPTPNPNSAKPLKILHPASLLLRKKRTREFKPKKTVRFNLMVKFSSSEEMLSHKLIPVCQPKDHFTSSHMEGLDLRSKSSLDVAGHSKVSWRNNLGKSLSCRLAPYQAHNSMHLQICQLRSQGSVSGSFSEQYLMGPILNLTRKLPRKGILKNVQSTSQIVRGKSHDSVLGHSSQGDSSRAPAQVSSWPSAHVSELVFNPHMKSSTAEFHHSRNPVSVFRVLPNLDMPRRNTTSQGRVCDELTECIQNLSISAHPQGDLPPALMNSALVLSEHAKFGLEQWQPSSSVYCLSSAVSTSDTFSSTECFAELETVAGEDGQCTDAQCCDTNNNAIEKPGGSNYNSNQTAHPSSFRNLHRKLSLPPSDLQTQSSSRDHLITCGDTTVSTDCQEEQASGQQPGNLIIKEDQLDSAREKSSVSKASSCHSAPFQILTCSSYTEQTLLIPAYNRTQQSLSCGVQPTFAEVQHTDQSQHHVWAGGSGNQTASNNSEATGKAGVTACGLVQQSRNETRPEVIPPPDDILYCCPILNCGMHFTQQKLLLNHVSGMQHSPCNPLSTLPDQLMPSTCGFLCPLCGLTFPDEDACLDHMLRQSHSCLMSPVPFSVFACPQCLQLFHSSSQTLLHMENMAHQETAFSFEYDVLNTGGVVPIPVPQRLVDTLTNWCSQVSYDIICQDCRKCLLSPADLQHHLDKCHILVAKCAKCVKDIFASLITDQACAECHQFIYTGLPTSELCLHADCPLQGPVLTSRARSLREFILRCGIADINIGTEENLDLTPDLITSSVSETCTVKYPSGPVTPVCQPDSGGEELSIPQDKVSVLQSSLSYTLSQHCVSKTQRVIRTSSAPCNSSPEAFLSAPTSDYTVIPLDNTRAASQVHDTLSGSLCKTQLSVTEAYVLTDVPMSTATSSKLCDPFEEGTSSRLCGESKLLTKRRSPSPVSSASDTGSSSTLHSFQAQASCDSSLSHPSDCSSKQSVLTCRKQHSFSKDTAAGGTAGGPISFSHHGMSSCSGSSVSCSTSSTASVISCHSLANVKDTSGHAEADLTLKFPDPISEGKSTSTNSQQSGMSVKDIKLNSSSGKDQANQSQKIVGISFELSQGCDVQRQSVGTQKPPAATTCHKAWSRPDLRNSRAAAAHCTLDHCCTFWPHCTNSKCLQMQGQQIQVEPELENPLTSMQVSPSALAVTNPTENVVSVDCRDGTLATICPGGETKELTGERPSLDWAGTQTLKRKSLVDNDDQTSKKAKVWPVKSNQGEKALSDSSSLYMVVSHTPHCSSLPVTVEESRYVIMEHGHQGNTQASDTDQCQGRDQQCQTVNKSSSPCVVQARPRAPATETPAKSQVGQVISGQIVTPSSTGNVCHSCDQFGITEFRAGSSAWQQPHTRSTAFSARLDELLVSPVFQCADGTAGVQELSHTEQISGTVGLKTSREVDTKNVVSEDLLVISETAVDVGSDSSDLDIVEIDELRDRFIVVNESLVEDSSCFIVESESELEREQDENGNPASLCVSLTEEEGTNMIVSEADESCFIVSTPVRSTQQEKASMEDSCILIDTPSGLRTQQSLARKKRKKSGGYRRRFSAKRTTKTKSAKQPKTKPNLSASSKVERQGETKGKPSGKADPMETCCSSRPQGSGKPNQLPQSNRNSSAVSPCKPSVPSPTTSASSLQFNSRLVNSTKSSQAPKAATFQSASPFSRKSKTGQQPMDAATTVSVQQSARSGPAGNSAGTGSSVTRTKESNIPISDSDRFVALHQSKAMEVEAPSTEQMNKYIACLGMKKVARLPVMRKWLARRQKIAGRKKSKLSRGGTSARYKCAGGSSDQYLSRAPDGEHTNLTGQAATSFRNQHQGKVLEAEARKVEQVRSEVQIPVRMSSLKLCLDGPTCVTPPRSSCSLYRRHSTTTVKRSACFRKLISPQINYLARMDRIVFADLENFMLFKYTVGHWLPSTFVWAFISARPRSPFHSERYFYQFQLYRYLKENQCVHISTEIGTSKDAVDFAMTLAIAKLDDRLPQSIPFFIVSRDKGFLEVESQMRASQRRVQVVAPRRFIFPEINFS